MCIRDRTSITDGGWGYLVSGVLLYLLRNYRKAQVAVWALNSFLWDFVLVYLQLRVGAVDRDDLIAQGAGGLHGVDARELDEHEP